MIIYKGWVGVKQPKSVCLNPSLFYLFNPDPIAKIRGRKDAYFGVFMTVPRLWHSCGTAVAQPWHSCATAVDPKCKKSPYRFLYKWAYFTNVSRVSYRFTLG